MKPNQQNSLFDEQSPPLPAAPALTVKISGVALSPEQQRFNKLLAQVEKLTQQIDALKLLGERYGSLFAQSLPPLENQCQAEMRNMALFLHRRLQEKGLTKPQRTLMVEMICNLAERMAVQGDVEMAELHDSLSELSLQDKRDEALANVKEMAEMSGDANFADIANAASIEEAMNIAMQAAMAHEEQQKSQDDLHQTDQAARRAKQSKSPKQKAAQQEKEDAQLALRTIYRQLASALHPDREPDPQERTRKTALMSQANAAYERRDLTSLLQLQLSIEHISHDAIARMASEKIKAFTVLLKEQATALKADLLEQENRIADAFGLSIFERPSETTLKFALSQRQQALRYELAIMQRDLQLVQEDPGLKAWLKEQKKLEREMAREAAAWDGMDAYF